MNKKELAAAVAERAGLSQSDAGNAVDAVMDIITETLKTGDEIRLMGFGTFLVSERAAGTGRNPQTGDPIEIKASKLAKFKPGAGLKKALND